MTRKTQFAWLAAGGLLGFASVVFGPKLLERSPARAQAPDPAPAVATATLAPALPAAAQAREPAPVPDGIRLTAQAAAQPTEPKMEEIRQVVAPDDRQADPPPPAVEPVKGAPVVKQAPPTPTDAQPPADPLVTALPAVSPSPAPPPLRVALTPPPPPPAGTEDPFRVESSPPPSTPPVRDIAKEAPAADVQAVPPPPASRKPEPEAAQPVAPIHPIGVFKKMPVVPSTDPSTPVNVPPVNVPPLPPTPDESVQQLQNQAPPALPRGDAPSPREAPPLTGVTTTSVSTAVTIVAKGARKPVPAAKARSLPLTGTHACLLDDKKGLTLPKTLREQLGEFDTLFVTPGADGSLWLTTACGLEKLTDKMEKGPQAGEEGRVHRRRYLAQTERVTVDKTGYVILTPALMQAAGVKQDLLLIGVGDHLELWETQRWKKFTEMEGAEGE